MATDPREVELRFPQNVCGIRSMKCECGWEVTLVIPEEFDIGVAVLLTHLQWFHIVKLPAIVVHDH